MDEIISKREEEQVLVSGEPGVLDCTTTAEAVCLTTNYTCRVSFKMKEE